MKADEVSALRGRKITIGSFQFLFMRKGVKEHSDVIDRNRTIARIAEEVRILKNAQDVGKAIIDAFDTDVGFYFSVEASKNRAAALKAGEIKQLTLWEPGEMVEVQTSDRAKKTAIDKPTGKKAITKKGDSKKPAAKPAEKKAPEKKAG